MDDAGRRDAVAGARRRLVAVSASGWSRMLLAAIGLYGVIAYSVARRTREIGIRMALGARPGTVLRLVLRQGLGLASIGLLIGCLLAAGVVRLLGSLLFGVSAADPVAWGVAAVTLLAVAGLANLVPARRAVRVSPSSALHLE